MTALDVHVLTESVDIQADTGRIMRGYLARPAATPDRAVLVGMELFGVTAHVRDVCDRLAAMGYLALAPDFYHRSAPGVELAADESGRTRGFALLHQLTRAQVLDDVGAALNYLAGRGTTVAGMVGLSVGGHLAYLAATEFELAAVAVLYGGWIPVADLPISQPEPTIARTAAIVGRMLFLVGEADPIVPPEDRAQLEAALTAGGVEHDLVEYPGVGHGFLCDRRAGFDPGAAADAWRRIGRLLKGTPFGRT